MNYKSILVYLNGFQNTSAILDAACQLVDDISLHVIGVFVKPNQAAGFYSESGLSRKMLQKQAAAYDDKSRETKAVFDKIVRSYGLQAEWHCVEGFADEVVINLSRYVDLVVMGQNGSVDGPSVPQSIPTNIVMGSARPVMMIPYIGFARAPGKKVLVAWNDSKEATRAINDALPILIQADTVEVLSVSGGQDIDAVPAADICIYLARHGVKAEASKVIPDGLNTSDILLNRISDRGIDLLVMGAYGHSRIREMILGGATYNVMRHMTVPVLLSH